MGSTYDVHKVDIMHAICLQRYYSGNLPIAATSLTWPLDVVPIEVPLKILTPQLWTLRYSVKWTGFLVPLVSVRIVEVQ